MKSSEHGGGAVSLSVCCAVVTAWVLAAALVSADVTVRQCVLGLRQRETSIEDISYNLSASTRAQTNSGEMQVLGGEETQWRRKGQKWKYNRLSTGPDEGKRVKHSEGYDGLDTWSIDYKKSGNIWGFVERKGPNNDLLIIMSGECFYREFGGRPFSEIVEAGDFTVEETDDGIWLKGMFSRGLRIAFLVDAGRGYMTTKIVTWAPDLGHSFEHPTQSYDALEYEEVNGFWMPTRFEFTEHPIHEGDRVVVTTVEFSEVSVNSGMSDDEFEPHWPKGARVTDSVANVRYTAGTDEGVTDDYIQSLDGETAVDNGVGANGVTDRARAGSSPHELAIGDNAKADAAPTHMVQYSLWLGTIVVVLAVAVLLKHAKKSKPA